MNDRIRSQHERVARIRGVLERQSNPRLQMFLIVLLTGMAGFFASFVMLHLGVTAMALRYFLALCVAYLMFLFILWVWLRWLADRGDGGDVGDLVDLGGWDGQSSPIPVFEGEGGSFDGGGASGSFEVNGADPVAAPDASSSMLDGVDVDPGDAAIPLAVVGLIAGVLFCALFVVYAAPVLFAELLVDGLLSASLYRRLRGIDRHHWLETALRRTVWPFVFAAISVVAIGLVLSHYTPGARTIGEAIGGHAQVGGAGGA